ncbi:DUF4962 domain-containing protein [Lacihabitans sp. LS3-19]|uniref:DUF4962 domain-containing protein n=1 Tax=Lacihabitans sp. LS3-19 TaxID=2487335 RepID=UPI0020CEDCA6|nr:DUF4962 domain-containing protein [Lacihabitans sp. LS3-19]
MNKLFFFLLYFLIFQGSNFVSAQKLTYKTPDVAVIYPKNRIWATPSGGQEAAFNSPSLQWSSDAKNPNYSVRISSSADYTRDLIEKSDLIYGIFNPHKILSPGTWYWQYKAKDGDWSPNNSFIITENTLLFETPSSKQIIANIPQSHPRVLSYKKDLEDLRIKVKNYAEASQIIAEANSYISLRVPTEIDLNPKFEGKNDFENKKIALLASKKIGSQVYTVLYTLCQAYTLTGEDKYFKTAKAWVTEAVQWDPNGASHNSDFGDAGTMAGFALVLDTFWDKISPEEKEVVVKNISIRANGFYKKWINSVEKRSSSMHVWQHIMHRMLYSSIALVGETPDAEKWLSYIYDIWIAQNPKMGEEDGAWFNGTGYFRMNTLTMYETTHFFNKLSGKDFMLNRWFKNNPKWLIYAMPPSSVSDGFCNDGNKHPMPTIGYAGYADAASRMFNDPYAAWYANEVAKSNGMAIAEDDEFRWFRVIKTNEMPLPKQLPKFDLPQAAVFPDVGVGYMHTNIEEMENNLMLSLRSSPFGSLAHTHADQNTFNIAFGGKRLFYNSGYRPAMGDPHFLGWYKHTQGHNAILIDGQGQPFNAGAYGLIPRFLHGEQISYAMGDASNAYSGKDLGENTDLGMKTFMRHYLMLRPGIIVIYDDLEADHKADWSWLLHNDTGLEVNEKTKSIIAQNEVGGAKVSLYSSSAINFEVSTEFSIPVDNWTKKTDEDGEPIDFKDQWHFKGSAKEKTNKMRYLAIFQVNSAQKFEEIKINAKGIYEVGDWEIFAELDSNKEAKLTARKKDGTASFVSTGEMKVDSKNYAGSNAKIFENSYGNKLYKESKDVIPKAILNAALMPDNK